MPTDESVFFRLLLLKCDLYHKIVAISRILGIFPIFPTPFSQGDFSRIDYHKLIFFELRKIEENDV
ncbi:hypothetical protein CFY87_02980 [Actinobacillus seminis]|uniref:Uncharacterized protein n=1 Tax=Actinobacillus seminis TaxID=722 RepID=A0ABX4FP17_9PAST|nr:hypothetical protein CFY87_02980 [Actinobacillus seminis]